MSKVYFDTGALVKLYIFEPGSAFVQRQAQKARRIDWTSLTLVSGSFIDHGIQQN